MWGLVEAVEVALRDHDLHRASVRFGELKVSLQQHFGSEPVPVEQEPSLEARAGEEGSASGAADLGQTLA